MSEKPLYNYDPNIWLRSCEEEISEPLEGKVTGLIPSWIQGCLLRNGPGCTKIGDSQYQHVFDGLALIHRFAIKNGRATYQCRYLRTETYKKNTTANRIVVTEFGTNAVPDPCRTIFDRISSVFNFKQEQTENAAVSIYPFGDQIYAMTEVPVLYQIDPESIKTLGRKPLPHSLIVSHTAHPHVMPNGDVYNVGLNTEKGNLSHAVVKFTNTEKGDMFETAEIVAKSKPRWRLNPSYMHSFGLTENYFVIIEQPLCVSLVNMMRRYIVTEPFASVLVSYPEYETEIVLIHRETGTTTRYVADTIYFMHIINCFEQDGKLMIDLCSYNDGKIIDAMYFEAIKSSQSNPDYGQWCRSRPKRIEIPLDAPALSKVETKLIADIGVEAPRINYELCNGKGNIAMIKSLKNSTMLSYQGHQLGRPYKYFYGIGSDVDADIVGSIIKVDNQTGTYKIWYWPNCYPSEPVFISHPDAKEEDDGVLLSAVITDKDDHAITLIVLNAKSLEEIARVDFLTPSPSPRCFHGWYLADKDSAN